MTKSVTTNKLLQAIQEYEQEWQQKLKDTEQRVKELERENAELKKEIEIEHSPWADIADQTLKKRLSRLGNPHLDTIIREAGVILEDRLRTVSGLGASKHGAALVDAAFAPEKGVLAYSTHAGEQDGVRMLYRGAMQFIRNPPMHKLIEYPEDTARLLVRLIDSLLLLLSEGTRPKPEEKQWNEATFFQALQTRHGPKQVAIAKKILDWAKRKMPAIYWGKGKRSGSFTPGLNYKDNWYQFIGVWTYGQVELQFQYLKSKPPFDSEAKRLELLHRWNKISGISFSDEEIVRRPTFSLAMLENDNDLASFLATLDWAVQEIKSAL